MEDSSPTKSHIASTVTDPLEADADHLQVKKESRRTSFIDCLPASQHHNPRTAEDTSLPP